MTDQGTPTARTVGGALLRQALDEVAAQVKAEAAAAPERTQLAAFLAYDPTTGLQLGAAVFVHGPGRSEWVLSGALTKAVTSAPTPYGVRLELRGRL